LACFHFSSEIDFVGFGFMNNSFGEARAVLVKPFDKTALHVKLYKTICLFRTKTGYSAVVAIRRDKHYKAVEAGAN
jgi:hypothetical protein